MEFFSLVYGLDSFGIFWDSYDDDSAAIFASVEPFLNHKDLEFVCACLANSVNWQCTHASASC